MAVSVAGGEARVLLQSQDLAVLGFVAWTPDGRHVLFGRHTASQQEITELWRIPAEGGEPQRLELAMENLVDLRVHPDGRRLAFTAGQKKAEIWVMENFLPATEGTK